MVGRDQHFGGGINGCVGLTYRVGQRLKIERMLKISRYGTEGRLPLELHQSAESVIIGGGGGRRGVLRIEREKQDALTTFSLQPTQHAIRGRVTITHTEIDLYWRIVACRKPHGALTRRLRSMGQQQALVFLVIRDSAIRVA